MAIVFVLPLFLLMALLPSTPGVTVVVQTFYDAISYYDFKEKTEL